MTSPWQYQLVCALMGGQLGGWSAALLRFAGVPRWARPPLAGVMVLGGMEALGHGPLHPRHWNFPEGAEAE